jgi:hypothetical protein
VEKEGQKPLDGREVMDLTFDPDLLQSFLKPCEDSSPDEMLHDNNNALLQANGETGSPSSPTQAHGVEKKRTRAPAISLACENCRAGVRSGTFVGIFSFF